MNLLPFFEYWSDPLRMVLSSVDTIKCISNNSVARILIVTVSYEISGVRASSYRKVFITSRVLS